MSCFDLILIIFFIDCIKDAVHKLVGVVASELLSQLHGLVDDYFTVSALLKQKPVDTEAQNCQIDAGDTVKIPIFNMILYKGRYPDERQYSETMSAVCGTESKGNRRNQGPR